MDKNIASEVLRWQKKLFSCSVRRQVRLKKISEMLGGTLGKHCLEITAGDGMISQNLRKEGGIWTTLALSPESKASLDYFVREDVEILDHERINAPNHTFDAVVLVDALEWMTDDQAFIKECHRVLKSDGRLIITAARKIPLCFGACFLRLIFGESWRRRGMARRGYSPRGFFDVLKDGFDVPQTISYSTCFVEIPGLLCELIANKLAHGPYNMPPEDASEELFYLYKKLHVLGMISFPFLWVLSQMEPALLFVMPGHNLIVQTKRRVWRERRTPILVDGRSIAEATINTKIGTAAPF